VKSKKSTRDNAWFDQAACRGVDPDVFFPEDPSVWPHAAIVKATCAGCPVRRQCIDYSLTTPQTEFGYWGLEPADRENLKRLKGTVMDGIEDCLMPFVQVLTESDDILV
jgi:WhiB family redox-sensing transcriptional regulator